MSSALSVSSPSCDFRPLLRDFFNRSTLVVARELLGTYLFYNGKYGVISEVEAYIGQDDPACHAAKGKTKRTEVMFGKPGYSYVYLIYGMYHCFNVVTEEEGFPAAVLIRGVITDDKAIKTDGPGKLCNYYNITRENNNLDISYKDIDKERGALFLATKEEKLPLPDYETTPRIGIREGTDKLWRFVMTKPSE